MRILDGLPRVCLSRADSRSESRDTGAVCQFLRRLSEHAAPTLKMGASGITRPKETIVSVSIALTDEQQSLLHVALGVAIRRFKENAEVFSDGSSADYNRTLAEQFTKQAEDAENLLMWIINAENIVIVEAND